MGHQGAEDQHDQVEVEGWTRIAASRFPVVPKKAPTPKSDDAISFDSLKKAKQMAEQLGGIQQAKAALAALAELLD